MKNLAQEVTNKINQIIEDQNLDGLIISDIYNIQYATGVKIPCAHAQTDLRIFAYIERNSAPIVIVPKCWENAASQYNYNAKIISYSLENDQTISGIEELLKQCASAKRLGSDDDISPIKIARLIRNAIAELGAEYVSCTDDLRKARSTKTKTEIKHLKSIAMKTDHAINGYFHHLIADRSKSSMSVSENLRIHSLERDIDLEGYNACSRGVIGNSISNIWAYAPKFGFAASDFTNVGDPIIADAMNNENGYWSNSTRIAIMSEEMSEDQQDAYGHLVTLRDLLCDALKVGRKCCEVYKDVISKAADLNISIIDGHALGFCVGASPMEGPF
ncbi:MAG: M24 family metallopeptidase, partial [Kordiimonadaceae bacterium]|nr:M24 family metallopeptidase [Kordiimonadaceae bacterium]